MQREGAMRRGAVQIDGRPEDGNLNQDDSDDQTENQRTKHASTSKTRNV
jgi:hypothetical protein